VKLDAATEARVHLGETLPCPECNWPLKVWTSSVHYEVPVVTCWTSGCGVHEHATPRTDRRRRALDLQRQPRRGSATVTLAPDQLEPDLEARVRLGENIDCPACGNQLQLWRSVTPPIVSCFNVGCVIHYATYGAFGID